MPVVATTVAGYIYASDAAVVEAYKDYNRCSNDSPRTLELPWKLQNQALSCMEYGYEPCQSFKVIFSWQQMKTQNNMKLIYLAVIKHGKGTCLFCIKQIHQRGFPGATLVVFAMEEAMIRGLGRQNQKDRTQLAMSSKRNQTDKIAMDGQIIYI